MKRVEEMTMLELLGALEEYGFECEGGDLGHCVEWQEIVQRTKGQPIPPIRFILGWLNEHDYIARCVDDGISFEMQMLGQAITALEKIIE